MKEERTQCFSETILEENKARGLILSGSRTYFGEGNGTPLQYSCLENPMDGRLQSMGSLRVGHD